MADHLKPTITSTYSNFIAEMDARFDDLAVGLDPAVTSATNVPVNATRWSSVSNKWQKYNGTAWNDLSSAYSINISGNAGTVTNGVYVNASYSNPSWITSLIGSKITGDISGNAGSATQLATARNINGVAFNGTAAISINLNSSITFNNTGTGVSSGASFNGSSATTISYNTMGAPSITGTNASGSWAIDITGNAATASTANIASDITTDVLSKIYPIGSIYINASNNSNPSVLLGFGTWVVFGAGRVMVGLNSSDTLFDTLEEIGGSKDAIVVSHTHTMSSAGSATGAVDGGNPGDFGAFRSGTGVLSAGGSSQPNRPQGAAGSNGMLPTLNLNIPSHTHTLNSEGSSGTNANLQPYVTVAMWKRTA